MKKPVVLERETRFELATTTLARWGSTTELLSHWDSKYRTLKYKSQYFFYFGFTLDPKDKIKVIKTIIPSAVAT